MDFDRDSGNRLGIRNTFQIPNKKSQKLTQMVKPQASVSLRSGERKDFGINHPSIA